jgi:hypothetical protein
LINTEIKKGTKEGEILNWALTAAEDYWCSEEGANLRGDKPYPVIYYIEKYYFIIPALEVIEDVIYRLDDQLSDMARGEGTTEEVKSSLNAARRAVKKIEKSKKYCKKYYKNP